MTRLCFPDGPREVAVFAAAFVAVMGPSASAATDVGAAIRKRALQHGFDCVKALRMATTEWIAEETSSLEKGQVSGG